MTDKVSADLATSTLKRIFVGARVDGMHFGVPRLFFDTPEVPGEPYVLMFSDWLLYPARPFSFDQPPPGAADQDDLLKAVALRHKIVESVEVLHPVPHLLLTFGDGSVLFVAGSSRRHEAWTAGLNSPTPADRVQVSADPGGSLTFQFPDVPPARATR